MKIVVIGPARGGKSTFGGMLADELGTKATDTSEALIRFEAERKRVLKEEYKLLDVLGTDDANFSLSETWDYDRDRPRREVLVADGNALCSLMPTILSEICLAQGDICVGVRRKTELEGLRAKFDDIVVIWVDRKGSGDERDNLDITAEDADHSVISRFDDLDVLRQAANHLALGLRA